MMYTREPAIKLFGKTISVPDFPLVSSNHSLRSPTLAPSSSSSSSAALDDSLLYPRSSSSPEGVRSSNDFEFQKAQEEGEHRIHHQHHLYAENAADSAMRATTKHPQKTSSPTETEPAEVSTSQEKTLKKPDRVLPCPRCNSMETKFCYYNNYNVNQPRHFCKNCQRYWTAGGTMRNVPIGAGRRKNKTYASQCRHITISDGFQPTHNDSNNILSSVPNGGCADRTGLVLAFGSDTSLCDLVHSGQDRAEPPGYGAEDSKCSVSCQGSDQICDLEEAAKNGNFPIQMPCFVSTSPWHYPWGHWRSSVDSMPLPMHPNALYWDASVRNWNVNLPCISFPSCENHTMSSSASASPTPGKRQQMDPTEISDDFLCISKKMKMGERTTHGGICNRECDGAVKDGVSSTVIQAKQGAFSRVIGYNENS